MLICPLPVSWVVAGLLLEVLGVSGAVWARAKSAGGFILFSPLASIHVTPSLWGAAVDGMTEPQEGKTDDFCFEGGEEERCVLFHPVLIVCVFRLAVSQTLLYSWPWRQSWGKEMDVSPILTLNSGDDDSSFLGNYVYGDERLKCCWRHQPADSETVVYLTLLPPNTELLPLPWIPDLQLYFRTWLITNFLK